MDAKNIKEREDEYQKWKKEHEGDVDDIELLQISEQVRIGNTSGILDNEKGYRIAWDLDIKKFKH